MANEPALRAWSPTLRERIKHGIAKLLGDDRAAMARAERYTTLLDLLPFVGAATGVSEANHDMAVARAQAAKGDYAAALGSLGAAGLNAVGALPVPGSAAAAKVAAQAARAAARDATAAGNPNLAFALRNLSPEAGTVAPGISAATGLPYTPEEREIVDRVRAKWGTRAENQAKANQRAMDEAAEMKAEEEAMKSAVSPAAGPPVSLSADAEKTYRARATKGAVAPTHWRDMQKELGEDAVLKRLSRGEHLRPDGNGGYIGAPAWVNSPQALAKLRRDLDAQFADAVEAQSVADPERLVNWYKRARASMVDSMEPHQLARGTETQAAYSAGVSPDSETLFAIKHANPRLFGENARAYRGPVMNMLDQSVVKDVPATLGSKTGKYRAEIDPREPADSLFGTNDFRWAQSFGYRNMDGSIFRGSRASPTMHTFMDGETALAVKRARDKRVGGRDDWTGPDMQEAPWVVTSKAHDLHLRGSNSPAARFADEQFPNDPLGGVGAAIREANKAQGDALVKHAFSVTNETRPGSQSNHMRVLGRFTPEEMAEYERAHSWALPRQYAMPDPLYQNKGDIDALYSAMGMRQQPIRQGAGFWKTPEGVVESNALTMPRPLVDFAQNETPGGRQVAPTTFNAIRAAENWRNFLTAQDANAANIVHMDGLPAANGLPAGRSPALLMEGPVARGASGGSTLPTARQLAAMNEAVDSRWFTAPFPSKTAYGPMPAAQYTIAPTNRGAVALPITDLASPETAKGLEREMGPTLQSIFPSQQRRVGTESFYDPAFARWGENGLEPLTEPGEGTARVLRQFAEQPPELARNLSESEGLRKIIGNIRSDDARITAALASGEKDLGANPRLQEARRFFSEGDWGRVVDLIRSGVAPSAAVAAVGFSLEAMAGTQPSAPSAPDGMEAPAPNMAAAPVTVDTLFPPGSGIGFNDRANEPRMMWGPTDPTYVQGNALAGAGRGAGEYDGQGVPRRPTQITIGPSQ